MALQWHSYLRKPQSALPISPESPPDDGLKRSSKQFAVLLVVIKEMHMNPQALSVGMGEKKAIHYACMAKDSHLFTKEADTFNGIWKRAVKAGCIKIIENSRAKNNVVRKITT